MWSEVVVELKRPQQCESTRNEVAETTGYCLQIIYKALSALRGSGTALFRCASAVLSVSAEGQIATKECFITVFASLRFGLRSDTTLGLTQCLYN